jgi:hypothetical protein
VHVIGVIVREQNRVDMIDSRRDELEPKLRWRVDENPRCSIGLYQRADSGSLVSRVG